MRMILAFPLSILLIVQASTAVATTQKLPPRHMTIGMLQIFCKKDGKIEDRLNVYGNGYCDGYLSGVIDSYFQQPNVRRASIKRNLCLMFPSHEWLGDEIREEILAVSESGDLDLDHGLRAELWVKARLASKCEPKK